MLDTVVKKLTENFQAILIDTFNDGNGFKDRRYWYSEYFVRIFGEEYGIGWQVWRDDKFTYRNGKFVGLIDGGLCEDENAAYLSAQEYVDNCLEKEEY
jgi:hypothetical protein